MDTRPANPILLQPIVTLPLSDAFKKAAAKHCFDSLQEMSALHMNELLALHGFDHGIWNEFVEFLEATGSGHLLNKKSPPRR